MEDNPEMAAEDILRDPIRRSQIETFESMFFNESSVEDLSHGFQVIAMNRDEKKFFIKMIKDYQIIIQLFPALFQLNAQKVVYDLVQEKKRAKRSKIAATNMQRDLRRV